MEERKKTGIKDRRLNLRPINTEYRKWKKRVSELKRDRVTVVGSN
jgi:hypothetical protein